MLSDLAMTREALVSMTMKPWSRVEEGSREGAPVRKNTSTSRRTWAQEEVGSRERAPQGSRWEQGEGLQGRLVLEVLGTGWLVQGPVDWRGPGSHVKVHTNICLLWRLVLVC